MKYLPALAKGEITGYSPWLSPSALTVLGITY